MDTSPQVPSYLRSCNEVAQLTSFKAKDQKRSWLGKRAIVDDQPQVCSSPPRPMKLTSNLLKIKALHTHDIEQSQRRQQKRTYGTHFGGRVAFLELWPLRLLFRPPDVYVWPPVNSLSSPAVSRLSATLGALSTCCSSYVYSRNKRRIEHLERHGVPLPEPVERCNGDCSEHLLLHFHLLCWLTQVRLSFSSAYAPGQRLWVSIGQVSVLCT